MKRIPFYLAAPLLLIPGLHAVRAAEPRAAAIKSAPSGTLPLKEVVLFSSGVGYFGRAGKVDGGARVDLTVRAPQLADILKSLVVLDPGGRAQPVTYSIEDWLARRPQQTDLKVDASATPGGLLRGFQGAMVRLERARGAVQGRVVSVNSQVVKVGVNNAGDPNWQAMEAATLATDAGLETVRLDEVTTFKLMDPALDAKLRASLEKMASAMTAKLDDGARTVSLRFAGKGSRNVRAGYLLETPVWKTSYRLVLDSKGKPYFQGWAVVENTSDEDWRNVQMTLVSGQPVSFMQDLAAPLYVSRPVVVPPVPGSARPQTYGEGYGGGLVAIMGQQKTKLAQGLIYDNDLSPTDQLHSRFNLGTVSEDARKERRMAVQPYALASRSRTSYANELAASVNRASMGGGAQAVGAQRGELFAYALGGGLNLPRGRAFMVPIVAGDVAGTCVSIVVSNGHSVGELSPSNGFALRNTTGGHLQGGPITVFDGGIYAGDALIGNVSPGETRLISYAADLELQARLDKVETADRLLGLSAANGNLVARYGTTRDRTWLFKNKSGKAKSLILQIPDEAGYRLANPKQLREKAADGLRFRVGVPPHKSRIYSVRTLTTNVSQYLISDMDYDEVTGFLAETAVSPKLKNALREVLSRRARLTALSTSRQSLQAGIREIELDQNRIRQNMARLSSTSALYKKYVGKLTAQEGQVESLRTQINRLRIAQGSGQAGLRAFINRISAR